MLKCYPPILRLIYHRYAHSSPKLQHPGNKKGFPVLNECNFLIRTDGFIVPFSNINKISDTKTLNEIGKMFCCYRSNNQKTEKKNRSQNFMPDE